MSRDFDALVEEALTALERGESKDAILERYPEEAHVLAFLLTTAVRCRQTLAFAEPPSQQVLAAGRRRFLEEAARQRAAPGIRLHFSLPAWLRPSLRPGLALAVAAIVLVLLVGGGATMAAARSLPGDPLYAVKLASEQARLALTFDPTARTELISHFADERRQEARTVAALGRQVNVRFQGVLESFSAESWTVGGLTVGLDEETRVEGAPTLGATIAVLAWSPGDGTLRARHLRVIPPVSPTGATPTSSPTRVPTHTPRPTFTRRPTPSRTPPGATVSPTGPEHEPTHGGPMTPTRRHGDATPQPTATHQMRPTQPAHTPQMPEPTRGPHMTPQPGETHGPHMTPGPRETYGPEPTQEPAVTDSPTPAPEPTEGATQPPQPSETPTQPSHGPMMTPGPHHTPQH